jgi:phosphohistidine swiveling domain-containing protein
MGTDMDMDMDMDKAATVMVMDTGTISHRALQISGKELCAS